MGLSKSHRIILLLIIDTIFFLIELSVGYAVHSLALVADSFHMLNDVLSLCVGLWAVKVANQKTSSKMYTYGWQRAETLGALVNGVFLVALCVSIFMEAIQRLVEPQEVKNPKLVCIVGCLGLLSNIVGLLLFHEHSHGHGHGHAEVEEPVDSAEQGYSVRQEADTAAVSDQRGIVASVMPENALGADSMDGRLARPVVSYEASESPAGMRRSTLPDRRRQSLRRLSVGSRGLRDAESIYAHPASLRQDIIKASRYEDETGSGSESDSEPSGNGQFSERSRLLRPSKDTTTPYSTTEPRDTSFANKTSQDLHLAHNHAQPPPADKKGGHGHSHGDLNMRGVFLHVVGDALGNIGVIASALIIWLTSYSWRFYVDPGISLLITIIILCSAIPLCKAASRILLQGVPAGLSIDHIIEDIQSLPGVISCHHLHVWQLSDTKLVASLHIQVSYEIKGEGSDRYMALARHVRRCLHAYGIHSSTIQPEFHPESDDEAGTGSSTGRDANGGQQASQRGSPAGSVSRQDSSACLLECGNECAAGRQCCPGGQ